MPNLYKSIMGIEADSPLHPLREAITMRVESARAQARASFNEETFIKDSARHWLSNHDTSDFLDGMGNQGEAIDYLVAGIDKRIEKDKKLAFWVNFLSEAHPAAKRAIMHHINQNLDIAQWLIDPDALAAIAKVESDPKKPIAYVVTQLDRRISSREEALMFWLQFLPTAYPAAQEVIVHHIAQHHLEELEALLTTASASDASQIQQGLLLVAGTSTLPLRMRRTILHNVLIPLFKADKRALRDPEQAKRFAEVTTRLFKAQSGGGGRKTRSPDTVINPPTSNRRLKQRQGSGNKSKVKSKKIK